MPRKTWFDVIGDAGVGIKSEAPKKEEIYRTILTHMFSITQSMFVWKGLPETIPQYLLELQLQTNGYSVITEAKGALYAFVCGLGDKPNPYYLPTKAVIANPALDFNSAVTLDKDSAWLWNDRLLSGLMPWNRLYAWNMAEAYCTLRLGLINSRAEYLISVSDDNEAQGAEKFVDTLMAGDKIAHLVSKGFMGKDDNQSLPYSANAINTIRSAVESIQFLYATWASGIGLQGTYNTKREYVTDSQTTIGDDLIVPNADEMLDCRKEGAEKLNRIYGLKVSVDFGKDWNESEDKPQDEAEGKEKADADGESKKPVPDKG